MAADIKGPADNRYVTVQVRTHNDKRYLRLPKPTASARELFWRLKHGPETSRIPGVLHIGRAGLCEALGWSIKDFDRCWAEVAGVGLAVSDWENRVIYLPGSLDEPNNHPSATAAAMWRRVISDLPDCALVRQIDADIRAMLGGLRKKGSSAAPALDSYAEGRRMDRSGAQFNLALGEPSRVGTPGYPIGYPIEQPTVQPRRSLSLSPSLAPPEGVAPAGAIPVAGVRDPSRQRVGTDGNGAPILEGGGHGLVFGCGPPEAFGYQSTLTRQALDEIWVEVVKRGLCATGSESMAAEAIDHIVGSAERNGAEPKAHAGACFRAFLALGAYYSEHHRPDPPRKLEAFNRNFSRVEDWLDGVKPSLGEDKAGRRVRTDAADDDALKKLWGAHGG